MALLKKMPPPQDDLGYVEVGYWLKQAFWGKAIAGEVARRMVKYGFEQLNLPFVVGVTHQDNIASQKSLNKAGLKRCGTIHAYEQTLSFFKIDQADYQL